MAGTGRVQVISKTPVSHNQYDVTISFDIAFDWGGWNSGASYTIYCNGQSSSGNASFSISSGGGNWVWGHIGTKTFRITMPTSGKSLPISFSAGINTGVTPSYIDAYGSDTLPARTWQWKVSYNANGGTGAPSSQTKTIDVDLKLSTTKPTRTGYTFLGWSTSKTASSASYSPGATYSSNAALTLYAVWKINTWTVKYDANGGTGAPSSQTKTYGQTLKLSTTKPTKKDYNFLGWGTSTESTTIEYEAGANYTNNAAITLYAVWELTYVPPRITDVHIDRCNSNGTLADDGSYVKIEFKWASDYPFKGYAISYRINSTNNWFTVPTEIYTPEPMYSGSISRVFEDASGHLVSFDIESEYDIGITVADTNGYSKITRRLPPMSFIIDILKGGKGIAFNRPATLEDTFEVDFDAKFDKPMTDRFGDAVENGLVRSMNEDPDTTLEHIIITSTNTPISGEKMYVVTYFYNEKSTGTARMQVAYPYMENGSQYQRYYYYGAWSPWRRVVNADELGVRSMTVMFPSGDKDLSGANVINCTTLGADTSNGYLTQSGGGIAIGKGVSAVLVSGNVFAWCQKIASNGYMWNRISRYRGSVETELCASISPMNAGLYASTVFSPMLVKVQPGDVIKIKKMNTENIRIRGLGNTYLTVQVAELE